MNLWSNTVSYKWNLSFLSDLDALTDLSKSRKLFYVRHTHFALTFCWRNLALAFQFSAGVRNQHKYLGVVRL